MKTNEFNSEIALLQEMRNTWFRWLIYSNKNTDERIKDIFEREVEKLEELENKTTLEDQLEHEIYINTRLLPILYAQEVNEKNKENLIDYMDWNSEWFSYIVSPLADYNSEMFDSLWGHYAYFLKFMIVGEEGTIHDLVKLEKEGAKYWN